ncbi:MAG: tetratricopeptide repeat protein, partial [Nanoarchaeota archaeon]|nr:tetratricopeptide repeat protein [Nanoarchaeota archaeon]
PKDSGAAFQLGVLYYKDEQYDKAKAAFIKAIGIDENFSNARYFLGLLYDREGKKDDAIDQFDRIAKLNPDNEEIKQILENLKTGKPALGSSKLGPPQQPSQIPIEEQPTGQ